jgi:putative SOS response-associated peptidase YedK
VPGGELPPCHTAAVCGRYTSTSSVERLVELFQVDEVRAEPLTASYNVAPTAQVYAVDVRGSDDGQRATRRVLETFRWGLVPSWAKDPKVGSRMINARAEGLATKPAFRAALSRRRCIIPADAFYEWERRPGASGRATKVPYAIDRLDGQPMAFAGLWEVWKDRDDPDAEWLRTCTIVTTEANALMAPIHDRMPVILEPEDWSTWLDPATTGGDAARLLVPAPPELFEAWQISTRVNDVRNDAPDLLDPVA